MKNSILKSCAVIATASVLFSSCATILDGGNPTVTLYGLPDNQRVTVITNVQEYRNVCLPKRVKVARHHLDGQPIHVINDNGERQTVYLEKSVNGLTLLNILVGGLIGFGIDCATNSVATPAFKHLYVNPNGYSSYVRKDSTKTSSQIFDDVDEMFK